MNDKYLDIHGTVKLLQDLGFSDMNEKKIRRAAETDKYGRRRLPFFRSPINGELVISEKILLNMLRTQQEKAMKR